MKKQIFFLFLISHIFSISLFGQGGETAAIAAGTPIVLPFSAAGTTVGKADDYNMPTGFASGYTTGPDWLYYFCATSTAELSASVSFTPDPTNGVFPSVSVWQGVPGVGTLVVSSTSVGTVSGFVIASFTPVIGTCYYVMVDNWPLPDGFAYNITIDVTPQPILQASCTNMGFETNDYTGWLGAWGNTVATGAVGAPTPSFTPSTYNTSTTQHAITSGTGVDLFGGFPVVCPGLGSNSLRLGTVDNNPNTVPAAAYPNYGGSMIEQKFSVTTSNALFTYYYAVVVEDGNGATAHASNEQPFFKVDITDCNGAPIACGQYLVTGGPGITGFTLVPGTSVYYKTWTPTFVDLTAYVGTCVTVKYTAADCSYGGHFCYAYVDAVCAPMVITGPTSICPNTSGTLTSPIGGIAYSWKVVGTATVLGTAQTLSVSPTVTTTYECTVTNVAGCNTVLTFTVNIYPTPTVTATPVTICAGSSGTMVATGLDNAVPAGGTYSWMPGSLSGASISPSPASTTTYTVTYTDPNLCVATSTAIATVNPLPVVTVNSPTICPTASATLTANGATSYEWNADPTLTANPYTVSPMVTTNYTVVGTANGCSASATAVVTVANSLNITVNSPSICAGSAATLTASGGTTYSWDQGASIGISTANPFSTSPAVTTTYTVTGTTNGCTGTANSTVTVNPIPTTTAGSNSPICAGATLNLTAVTSVVAGATYSWTGPGFTSALQNPSFSGTTVANSGSYIVTVSANGCSSTSTVVVVVNPVPTTTAASNTPCEGSSLNLTAVTSTVSGSTYSWTGPGFVSALQNPSILPSVVANSGSYIVTVSANSCSSTSSVNVTVNPVPTTTAGSNAPICEGTTLNLTAVSSGVAGSTYSWTGPMFTSALQNPTISGSTVASSGSYTVTVTANSCSSTSMVNVVVNPTPTTVAGSNSPLCEGDDLNLTATNSVGSTFAWTGPGLYTSPLQNPTINSVTLTDAGNYIVTVSANGCSSTSTVNVVVVSPTIPVFLPVLPLCEGDVPPSLQNPSSDGITGTWISSTISAAITGPTTYTFTPDAGQCALSTSIVVTVNPLPVLIITSPGDTCIPYTVDITAAGVTAGSLGGGTLTYWQDSATTIPLSSPASIGLSGTYYIESTSLGCSSVSPVLVTIHPLPIASFIPSPSIMTNIDPTSTMINTSSGADTYFWDFGDGETSILTNPSHYFPDIDSGTYVINLIATTSFGCLASAVATVKVEEELIVYVPNTFTPDKDNFNEMFLPVFTSGFDPYDYRLLIFNRWGAVIFESHNAEIGWKGLYGVEGDLVQDDTYTWKIDFTVKSNNKRKTLVGHVNVLR